jgi:hypothetical protein
MTKEIEKLQADYLKQLEISKVAPGQQRTAEQAAAFLKKAEIMGQIRAAVRIENAKEKRSLQQEYIRKFDDQAKVMLPEAAGEEPRPTTLRDHHKERLGHK